MFWCFDAFSMFFFIFDILILGNDQEVKFHEIKIHFSWGQIHEIEFFFIFHEAKIPNSDSISWLIC